MHQQLDEIPHTQKGMPITDVVRFFHEDGPAQQFEAGNKVGRHHPVMLRVHTSII